MRKPRILPRLTAFYIRQAQNIDDTLGLLLLLALVAVLIFLPEILT